MKKIKLRESNLIKLIKRVVNEKKQLTEDKKFTCHECHPTGRRGKGQCHHVASFLGTNRPADCMSWDACLLDCEGIVIDYDKVRQNTGNPADAARALSESGLRRLIKRVITERVSGWDCVEINHVCNCEYNPSGQGQYTSHTACMNDNTTCCGGAISGTTPDDWYCVDPPFIFLPLTCTSVPGGNPAPAYTVGGPFTSQSQCQQNCQAQPRWACENGQCVQEPNGPYQTVAACQAQCETPLTWKCKNKGSHPKFGKHCVQVPSGGDFATKQQCQASKGCAQLHDKGYQVDIRESHLRGIIKRVIKEQGSSFDWESSLDGWDIQKDAREEGKYCQDEDQEGVGYFEGQYCNVETNWYDWENFGTSVNTISQSHSGRWKCGVGCIIPEGESGRWGK